MLQIGTQAPAFTLNDKDGNAVSLADFKGKKVVLYFYPRDNTPGCTRQACALPPLSGFFRKEYRGDRCEQGQRCLPPEICSEI